MDELNFRRSIYADPNTKDPEVLKARAEDPAKQKFAQSIEQLDQKLAQAMKVPVPDDLANKLILRQTLASHQQQKRKNRIHLALAASVAFALGLSFNMMQSSNAYDSLGDQALAHVYHEADHFHNDSSARVSLASLNSKMSDFDAKFTSSFGELLSAGYCYFDGFKSLHLVFQGKTSPVSVFVMPHNQDLSFDSSFADDKLHGLSQQYQNTDIVIVGDKNEAVSHWQENINSNIQWSI